MSLGADFVPRPSSKIPSSLLQGGDCGVSRPALLGHDALISKEGSIAQDHLRAESNAPKVVPVVKVQRNNVLGRLGTTGAKSRPMSGTVNDKASDHL